MEQPPPLAISGETTSVLPPPFAAVAYIREYTRVLSEIDLRSVAVLVDILSDAYAAARTVFCVGNGGSAATASHLATDLSKLTTNGRMTRRLRAMALTESQSSISAIANDFCYEDVFVEQLRTFLDPGDVIVAISSSGASANVLRAVEYGRSAAATTFGIAGAGGALLQQCAHHTLTVPSRNVQQIEDATMVVAHLACLELQQRCAHAQAGSTARCLEAGALRISARVALP